MKFRVEPINQPIAEAANVQLNIARADQLHHLASGNKIYKLTPNINFAKSNNISNLLSFGGAFSNHIHALALLANANGMTSIGIIRGEPEYARNPTLMDVQSVGMELEFVDRKTYQQRYDLNYLNTLQERYPDSLIIPEGGSSQLAVQGCTSITKEINQLVDSDFIVTPAGTGATFAGVVCGLREGQAAIAYSVLKDTSLKTRVESFIKKQGSRNSLSEKLPYHIEGADYGGYAKLDAEHLEFILGWLDETGILLDPIYTSKMCRRLLEQIGSGEFNQGTKITMVHTGGLQGWRGMKDRVIRLSGKSIWSKIEANLV